MHIYKLVLLSQQLNYVQFVRDTCMIILCICNWLLPIAMPPTILSLFIPVRGVSVEGINLLAAVKKT